MLTARVDVPDRIAGRDAGPLEQKLGVKAGGRVAVLGGPPGFSLAGVRQLRRLAPQLELIVCFVRTEAELRRQLPGWPARS